MTCQDCNSKNAASKAEAWDALQSIPPNVAKDQKKAAPYENFDDSDELLEFVARIKALEAENERLKLSRPRWQPIETAPRDGTLIDLGAHGGWVTVGSWQSQADGGGWWRDHVDAAEYQISECLPTHWAPRPEPPVKVTEDG